MKIGDVYIHKTKGNIIQIDSFVQRMNDVHSQLFVVYANIERHNEYEIGSCPSRNGYGSREEIEREYDLLVSEKDLEKYANWEEVFELVARNRGE
jgi:hypothetical protein